MMTMNRPVGELLRDWRQRRRFSQLDLASEADVSTRHISFLETGRAQPSREMLLRLADQLQIPLREQNALLIAAGFAPIFRERPLDDPALQPARAAIDLVLSGHEPNPAIAVDRHWSLVAANRASGPFFADLAPELAEPPINVLRATLHPDGLAPRIANYSQWRAHMFARVRRQIDATADPVLSDLLRDLRGYPVPDSTDELPRVQEIPGVVVPLRLRTEWGVLSFLYTMTVFGTPVEVTVSEIAIESFFPADEATAATLRQAVES